jgi:hypothetical protein
MATAAKSRKTTATAPASEATAPAPDATPTNELPNVSATAPASEATAPPVASAPAPAPTLQEALTTAPAPRVTADSVADAQRVAFNKALDKATTLAMAENQTIIDIGGFLQEAIDAFKPLIPKADWWRQRADTIADFEQRYRLRMNGRTPRAYEWLTCYHVHKLASDEAKAILTTGRGGRPFPIATIDAIGVWLTYDKATDEWSIKAGYESDLDALVLRVADDGLTTAQTTEAMKAIDASKRLASAEAIGGAKAKATEEKAQKAKAKADRSKAIDKALDKLAETLASDTIGGASASELLNRLADRGLAEATGLVDPATMTPTEALAFAQRLCELDRADIIFVILTRLRTYEANALAKQEAPAPAPCLDATASA